LRMEGGIAGGGIGFSHGGILIAKGRFPVAWIQDAQAPAATDMQAQHRGLNRRQCIYRAAAGLMSRWTA
jgi:hypothetical protein